MRACRTWMRHTAEGKFVGVWNCVCLFWRDIAGKGERRLDILSCLRKGCVWDAVLRKVLSGLCRGARGDGGCLPSLELMVEEQEALPGRCPTAMCPIVSHCWRGSRLGATGAGEPVLAQPDGARHGTEAPGVSTLARDWVHTNLPGRAQPTPRSFLSYLQEINVHRSASLSERERCWWLAGHPAEDQPGWSAGRLLYHGRCLPWAGLALASG